MRLNKISGYAIRILVQCAMADGGLIKTEAISSRLNIKPHNSRRVTRILADAGFVETALGSHGGVRLALPADQIRIGEIVRCFEAIAVRVEHDCPRKIKAGKVGSTGMNRLLEDALDAFMLVLDSHTLAEIVPSGKNDKSIAVASKAKPRAASFQDRLPRPKVAGVA